MVEIKSLEIFRTGNYGELGEFSETDLDEIAAEYSADKHKAPITLGHVEDDSKPALGWINKIYRKGMSLFADGEIVAELKDWISQGLYENVSAAIYKNFAGSGKKYLRHLAVLGAVPPVVKGMGGLKAAMFSDSENGDYGIVEVKKIKQEAKMPEKDQIVVFSEDQHKSLLEAALLKKENELTLKFAEIQKASDSKVTALEAEIVAEKAKVTEFAEKATAADVEKFIDGLIMAKKTTPALKDALVGQLKKAAKLDMVLFSEMKANMEAALPVIEFGEVPGAGGSDGGSGGEVKDGKISIGDAMAWAEKNRGKQA
ncbi:MAG: hypothetical protein KKC03_13840 [Bacteroidetes bacterium]|nr:hypothetical protein [Bacteroidota bacterium]